MIIVFAVHVDADNRAIGNLVGQIQLHGLHQDFMSQFAMDAEHLDLLENLEMTIVLALAGASTVATALLRRTELLVFAFQLLEVLHDSVEQAPCSFDVFTRFDAEQPSWVEDLHLGPSDLIQIDPLGSIVEFAEQVHLTPPGFPC